MRPLMQGTPLSVHMIRERASSLFADREVTGREERLDYAAVLDRAERLAAAFDELGIPPDAAIATFAWNTPDHLAAYVAAPCSGRVLHTVNIRMHPDQIGYTLRVADDRAVVVDGSLCEIFAEVAVPADCRHVVVAGTTDDAAVLRSRLPARVNVHLLTDLTQTRAAHTPWRHVTEDRAAGICFTSGTTGPPKGVVYSHRSTYLHALTLTTVDGFAIGHRDVTLPVVPMFHANAWGLPYASMLAGAGQALPGSDTSPSGLRELISRASVTMSAGVPTVWQEVAAGLRDGSLQAAELAPLERIVIGGSAVPRSMVDTFESAGIRVLHAWGMTECSPVGLVAFDPVETDDAHRRKARLSQGRPLPGLTVRTVPVDGTSATDGGELQISGPWVAEAYLDADGGGSDDRFERDDDRVWLRTGDVAEIDGQGYVWLIDRTKDLVKSGGEWISSVDLEDRLTSHPGVVEAAVIAIPHERWGERPLAFVVAASGEVDVADLERHLAGQIPKWQLPDRYEIVPALPRTSVGKIDKKLLRSEQRDSKRDTA